MEIVRESRALSQIDADLIIVGYFQGEKLKESLSRLDGKLKGAFLESLASEAHLENFTGKSGQTLSLPSYGQIAARRLLLLGLGKRSEAGTNTLRKAIAATTRR